MKKIALMTLAMMFSLTTYAKYDHTCNVTINGKTQQDDYLIALTDATSGGSTIIDNVTTGYEISIKNIDKKNVGQMATIQLSSKSIGNVELSIQNIDPQADMFSVSSLVNNLRINVACSKF